MKRAAPLAREQGDITAVEVTNSWLVRAPPLLPTWSATEAGTTKPSLYILGAAVEYEQRMITSQRRPKPPTSPTGENVLLLSVWLQ